MHAPISHYIRAVVTTLKPLTGEVSNTDYLVEVAHVKEWGILDNQLYIELSVLTAAVRQENWLDDWVRTSPNRRMSEM